MLCKFMKQTVPDVLSKKEIHSKLKCILLSQQPSNQSLNLNVCKYKTFFSLSLSFCLSCCYHERWADDGRLMRSSASFNLINQLWVTLQDGRHPRFWMTLLQSHSDIIILWPCCWSCAKISPALWLRVLFPRSQTTAYYKSAVMFILLNL